MPRTKPPILIWSVAAREDLIRLRRFLESKSPGAARQMAGRLIKGAHLLQDFPKIGRSLKGRTDRELDIPFGRGGYVMRYSIAKDEIVILRLWHSLEDRNKN